MVRLIPSTKARDRASEAVVGPAARLVARIVGMRVEVIGRPPQPPFLLAANHLSYLDIVLVRRTCGAKFIAKSDVAGWPIIGALTRLAGTVFVDRRNKRDLKRIKKVMESVWESGSGLAIFPEGTSTAGSSVGSFLPGLLEEAAQSGRPVHTATIYYDAPAGHKPATALCWWGRMTFADHLYGVLRLPYFTARITFGDGPVVGSDRKSLADALRAQILTTFEPIPGAPSA